MQAREGGALTGRLGGVLTGGCGARHSPAHGHPLLTRAGCAGLIIGLPLDPLSKLLSIQHTGYSKGAVTMATRTPPPISPLLRLQGPSQDPSFAIPTAASECTPGGVVDVAMPPYWEGTPLHLQPLEAVLLPSCFSPPPHTPGHSWGPESDGVQGATGHSCSSQETSPA